MRSGCQLQLQGVPVLIAYTISKSIIESVLWGVEHHEARGAA